MYIYIHGVPRLLGQTFRAGRGHHKNSDLHNNLWSEMPWESSMRGTRNEETKD